MNKYVKNKYIYTVSYIKYYIKIIFNHIPGALATPSRLISRCVGVIVVVVVDTFTYHFCSQN